ncbi:hypothetical protein SVIOM342S_08105 [Streptomyces violaceorubidus]
MKWGGRVYVTLRPRFGPKERAPHWPARCMTWRQRGHMVWKAGMTRSPAQGPVRATTSSPSSSTVRKAPSSASAIAATTCPACSSVRWAPVAEAAVRAGIAGRAAHHIGRSRAGSRCTVPRGPCAFTSEGGGGGGEGGAVGETVGHRAPRTSARATPSARRPTDSSAADSTWAWTPSIEAATSATGVPVRAYLARNCRSNRRALAAAQVIPVVFVMR